MVNGHFGVSMGAEGARSSMPGHAINGLLAAMGRLTASAPPSSSPIPIPTTSRCAWHGCMAMAARMHGRSSTRQRPLQARHDRLAPAVAAAKALLIATTTSSGSSSTAHSGCGGYGRHAGGVGATVACRRARHGRRGPRHAPSAAQRRWVMSRERENKRKKKRPPGQVFLHLHHHIPGRAGAGAQALMADLPSFADPSEQAQADARQYRCEQQQQHQ